jgi:hypothetical protein
VISKNRLFFDGFLQRICRKEVCHAFADRPLKNIRLLGKENMFSPCISLSEFSLTTAMQILRSRRALPQL